MNGCYNRRPYVDMLPMQDGWYMDGVTRTPRMEPVKIRVKPDCQYTGSALGQADKGCTGCSWRSTPAAPAPATPGASK